MDFPPSDPHTRTLARRLPAPFPGIYFRRSVAYWAMLHVAVGLLMAWGGYPSVLSASIPGGNPLVPLLVPVLGMAEARRRDETLFLANLGYGWPTLAAYLAAPAAVLEAAFTVARFG